MGWSYVWWGRLAGCMGAVCSEGCENVSCSLFSLLWLLVLCPSWVCGGWGLVGVGLVAVAVLGCVGEEGGVWEWLVSWRLVIVLSVLGAFAFC